MEESFAGIIEKAILMEHKVGELYRLFYTRFPEDSEFWWKLAIEEDNHAALLKTVRQMESLNVEIPGDFLPEQLAELNRLIGIIQAAIDRFSTEGERDEAFQLAYRIENSAGELHYDEFMKRAQDSPVTHVFRKLNGDDLNHAGRIRDYMERQGIMPEDGSGRNS